MDLTFYHMVGKLFRRNKPKAKGGDVKVKKTKGYPAKMAILILCGLLFSSFAFTVWGSSDETEPILIPLKNIGDLLKYKSFPYYGAEADKLAFSPDGKFLAIGLGYKKGSIYLWNLESGKISALTSFNYTAAPRFCFSPDGKTLASIIDIEHLILFDVVTGSSKALYHAPDYRWRLYGVSFSPGGNTIASVGNFKNIDIWDARSGKKIKTLKHKFDFLSEVRFNPDGNTLAAVIGYDNKDEDNGIGFWDLKTGKMAGFLKGHTKWVRSFAFSSDGGILASGSVDKSIILWDVATGNKIKHIQGLDNDVLDLAFSPNGKILAAALESSIMLLDLETNEKLTVAGLDKTCRAVAFSPDGNFLAMGRGEMAAKATENGTKMEYTASASLWDLSFFSVKRKFAKDAFETVKEYEARMGRVEIPYSTFATLEKERYNANQGGFEIEFMGNRLFIPVERDKAKELAARKTGEVELAGKLKYYNPENLALVESWIVDLVSRERYAVHNKGWTGTSQQTGTESASKSAFGVSARPVNADDQKTLGLPSPEGLLVTEVKKGSPAEHFALRVNDVILAVNGVAIKNSGQLKEILASGEVKSVKIFRGGSAVLLEAAESF
jgi:WD40 repeat protein